MTTRRQKTSRFGDVTADDVAPRLTITMDVPEVIDLRSDPEGSSLGQVISSEQALALRPHLEDPTRLTNGALHPRYAEWIVSRSWAEQHPLSEYLIQPKYLDRVTDDRGYFDRQRVNRALGPSGSKSWLADGPLPTKACHSWLSCSALPWRRCRRSSTKSERLGTTTGQWLIAAASCRTSS